MLLDVLFEQYNGKTIDVDNTAGCQCVDWVKCYIQNCLYIKTYGKGTSPWGNAIDYYTNTNSQLLKKCKRVPYNNNMQILKGDIVIWDTGTYGHIAVCYTDSIGDKILTIDQNYGKNKTIRKVTHTRTNIVGVLRPIRTITDDVNVRSAPSGTVINELKKGEKVNIISRWGNWYKIGAGKYIYHTFVNNI